MTVGIKVSLPGKDISSTNPSDFVLHSQYGSAVIYKEAEVSVTLAANAEVVSTVEYYDFEGVNKITFPYIPVVYIMAELTPGSGVWYSSPFTFTESMPIDSDIPVVIYHLPDGTYTAVENNKFYITFKNKTGSSKTIKYHYYIFSNLAVV